MKFILLVTLFCLIGLNFANAQQGGAQTLRLAQSIYEQGRLHELPTVLRDSAVSKFSKAEQVSAYKLLTLAYIYLEEPELADKSMLKLLNTDHFFELNKDVEPAEFVGLYNTFRTKPVFNIGLKFGVNGTAPLLNSVYYVSNNAAGKGKNTVGVGFQVGFVFQKEILSRSKNKLYGNGRLIFSPEVFYTNRTFGYSNPSLFVGDSLNQSAASIKGTIKQNWIDVNPIVHIKFGKSRDFVPYLGFGPGVSYLLSAPNTLVLSRKNFNGTNGGGTSGPDVPFALTYHKIVPSLIGVAGVKYRLGEFYVTAEFRVQYGLANPVNSSARTNTAGAFDYNYVSSDYKPLNLMANIGFVFPYFNPIKLKRK